MPAPPVDTAAAAFLAGLLVRRADFRGDLAAAFFFAAGFLAARFGAAFLAVAFLAVFRFAVRFGAAFLAVAFLAVFLLGAARLVVFFAATFLVAARLVVFLATAFLAPARFGAAFLVVAFLAPAFLGFLAADFRAPLFLVAFLAAFLGLAAAVISSAPAGAGDIFALRDADFFLLIAIFVPPVSYGHIVPIFRTTIGYADSYTNFDKDGLCHHSH